jgi:hypothetical protein
LSFVGHWTRESPQGSDVMARRLQSMDIACVFRHEKTGPKPAHRGALEFAAMSYRKFNNINEIHRSPEAVGDGSVV